MYSFKQSTLMKESSKHPFLHQKILEENKTKKQNTIQIKSQEFWKNESLLIKLIQKSYPLWNVNTKLYNIIEDLEGFLRNYNLWLDTNSIIFGFNISST